MPDFLVTVTYPEPLIHVERVEVTAGNPEHAVMVARAQRKWLPGSTFAVRPVDSRSYSLEPTCNPS